MYLGGFSMCHNYAVTDISEYHDESSYFLWVFFHTKKQHEYKGCPLGRPSLSSMITDTLSLEKVFNPTDFMNTCKLDWDIPRMIIIPDKMEYAITDDNWIVLENRKPHLAWDDNETDSIIKKSLEKNQKHILITGKYQEPEHWFERPKTLEDEKRMIIDNEAYDDYYYDKKRDGGLWCSGISMHDDQDNCYNYQLSHPDYCKNCTRIFKVKI